MSEKVLETSFEEIEGMARRLNDPLYHQAARALNLAEGVPGNDLRLALALVAVGISWAHTAGCLDGFIDAAALVLDRARPAPALPFGMAGLGRLFVSDDPKKGDPV